MTAYDWFLIGHVLVFGIWFGTDVATFILSRRVLDSSLEVVSRRGLAGAMVSIEVIARLCLPTMLALGLSLSIDGGLLDVPQGWIAVVWVVAVVWVALVWTVHRSDGASELGSRLALADLGLRSVICVALWIAGIWSLVGGDGPFLKDSVATKVVLFAVIMSCGIAIRFLLRPFGTAFGELVRSGSTPEREAAVARSLRGAQPLVGVIWFCLLSSVVLGVAGMLPWE